MTEKTFYNSITNDIEDILKRFLNILSENNVDYCIIGGLAVNAYAEPVVSLDLDIVIALKKEQIILDAIKNIYSFEIFEHSINLTSNQSNLRIQIQKDKRYQEFIKRAKKHNVLGYTMNVASLEDVLYGKLWAYQDPARRKSKRQKDLADIFRLIETHPYLKEKLPEEIKIMMI